MIEIEAGSHANFEFVTSLVGVKDFCDATAILGHRARVSLRLEEWTISFLSEVYMSTDAV